LGHPLVAPGDGFEVAGWHRRYQSLEFSIDHEFGRIRHGIDMQIILPTLPVRRLATASQRNSSVFTQRKKLKVSTPIKFSLH
jgi:hypothetical protein